MLWRGGVADRAGLTIRRPFAHRRFKRHGDRACGGAIGGTRRRLINRREATGKGCVVDTSLFESAVAWGARSAEHLRRHRQTAATAWRGQRNACPRYQIFPDRRSANLYCRRPMNRLFVKTGAVDWGCPEWASDPRFSDGPQGSAAKTREALGRPSCSQSLPDQNPAATGLASLARRGVPGRPCQRHRRSRANPKQFARNGHDAPHLPGSELRCRWFCRFHSMANAPIRLPIRPNLASTTMKSFGA